MRISDVNPQKAELSLGEILGAANGFFYPIVNIQSLVLAKLVDLKPLALHCLLITAYSDVSVNHILVINEWCKNKKRKQSFPHDFMAICLRCS